MVRDTPPLSDPPGTSSGFHDWPSQTLSQWILWALIVPVAAFLRLHAVTAKSFWLDEGMSAGIARLPWLQFFRVLWNREINMAFYYVLLHFWMRAGSGEAFVRGLSVVFSVATVPLIYSLGTRMFGRTVGLTAAWLLAINAYHVRYAQEARSYALVAFLATLATWLLVRNLQQPSTTRWGAYSVACALLVYAQLFAVLLVLAHALSLLWLPRDSVASKTPWKDFARAVRWIAYMIFPAVLVALHIGSTPAAWIRTPTIGELSNFFQSMAGNRGFTLVLLDALLLAAAALALFVATRANGRSLRSWGAVVTLAWLFVPIILILAVSVVRPIFVGRYLLFCLPALALAVATGFTLLRPAVLRWALLVAMSVLSIQGTISYYHQDFDLYREDWRSATAYILDNAQPGDGIFFSTFGRMPYEYYKSQRQTAPSRPIILNWPGAAQLDSRDFIARPVAEMLGDVRPAPDRVWLVLFLDRTQSGQINPTSIMLRGFYEKGRRLVQEQEFPQITIFLFARDQPTLSAPPASGPLASKP